MNQSIINCFVVVVDAFRDNIGISSASSTRHCEKKRSNVRKQMLRKDTVWVEIHKVDFCNISIFAGTVPMLHRSNHIG